MRMPRIIFILSSLLVIITSAAYVKDTLYYDLLQVDNDDDIETINRKSGMAHNFICSTGFFKWQSEEAKRLCGIFKDVLNIITDPALRLDYDLNGPKLSFTTFEYSKLSCDNFIMRKLTDNANETIVVQDPFDDLHNAHVKNETNASGKRIWILHPSSTKSSSRTCQAIIL